MELKVTLSLVYIFVLKRLLAQACCMTGADLNSSSKPWTTQQRTTGVVYREFHEQVMIRDFRTTVTCKNMNLAVY